MSFFNKFMLERVQIAIEESGFPIKNSSGIGKMILHSSPIASPKAFIVYHAGVLAINSMFL